MMPNNTLPSFDEFIRNTFAKDINRETHHANYHHPLTEHGHGPTENQVVYMPNASVYSSSNTCVGNTKNPLKRSSPVNEFDRLNAEIVRQKSEISRLVQENELLKSKKRKVDYNASYVGQPVNSPQPSHTSNSRNSPPIEFTVIAESSLNHTKQDIVKKDLDNYIVTWNNSTYVISNIFTNKDDISHFYCPRYETYHPKKEYKVVVEKNEYRQLLNENTHIVPLFKKRAWRVSLFTMDFVNFVRECNQSEC